MLNKFYLQLFAEEEAAGADSNSGGTEAEASNTEQTRSNDLITFDDFLKDSDNQAEFDRRVQKAIKTAVSNAEKKWKAATDDQLSEAEKLAQMTREEKAELVNRFSSDDAGGIGLANLYRRLVLRYGEESGLRVWTKKGMGTAVSFYIPCEQMKV